MKPAQRGDEIPAFRIWPPVAIAVPWAVGWGLGELTGRSLGDAGWVSVLGSAMIAGFAIWNGWCLWLFRRHTTGLLPGQRTQRLLSDGPYRISRNPLYLGLLSLYVGCALVADSLGALILTPAAWAGLHWGAILPEERYLSARLGEEYAVYLTRVPRWL